MTNFEKLNPKARGMLEEMRRAARPDSSQIPIEDARANLERLMAEVGPGPGVQTVEERLIATPPGPLPVRVYRGREASGSCPLIVYFHGGGHAQGSIATSDALCRGLANACRAIVANVEYRLAPEHQFPAAYEDAVFAVEWGLSSAAELGADPTRVVVAGDSAGGNLTMAVLATTDLSQRVAAEILIYPLVSFARQGELYDDAFDDFFLNFAELEHFAELYIPAGIDRDDPRLSPLGATSLEEMPPSLIVAAECDPIHLQAEAADARLVEEGASSKLLVYDGMIHGFYGMTGLFEEAQAAFDDVATELDLILGVPERA
ncbi:MAG TPA: alpha/beta hydrolase [Solirubrobacterales bacterium]|nr:alpha/beta hydrolase [Solirubrobacterales bacterium]